MSTFSKNDLFVSTEGNDFWSGTLAEPNADRTDGPLATLEFAKRAIRKRKGYVLHRQVRRYHAGLKEPFTIWLRGGLYRLREPVVFTHEDSAPVTFAAYPGEHPVIDGSRMLSSWSEISVHGAAAWVCHIPEVLSGQWEFRELYVNGERRQRPRYPRDGLLKMEDRCGPMADRLWHTDDTQFVAAKGDFREFEKPSDIEVVYLHRWIDERSGVQGYDPDARVVTLKRPSIAPIEGGDSLTHPDYYIDNVFEELRDPGEWYLDRSEGNLYYIPMPGETHQNTEICAPYCLQLLVLKGDPDAERYVEFLRFEGVTFQNTDWRHPDPSDGARFVEQTGYHDVFQDYDMRRGNRAGSLQGACDVPGVVMMEAARHCHFMHCRVKNVGWYGFEIGDGCSGIAIQNCSVKTTGAGGIKLNGSTERGPKRRRSGNHSLTDNEISEGGRVFHSAVGVLSMNAFNTEISHNHIHDYFYTGISCGWDWGYMDTVSRDNRIEKNHIHDIGQGLLSDMGGIYLLGVQPGTVVRGNVIHDITKAHYGGWAIYTDEGSSHMLIENNICYRTNDSIFNQHYGRENLVRNNIFAFGGSSVLSHSRADAGQVSIRFERNILLTDGKPIFLGGYQCSIEDYNHRSDLNVLWDVTGAGPTFSNGGPNSSTDLATWRDLGHDVHSLIADPLCADLEHGNFTISPDSPVFTLGISAIDASDVGPRG